MDKCTHEVRAAQWSEIIQQCQQRPEGQSAKQWLDKHHILNQSYYYWLRKLRNQAYEQMESSTLPVLQPVTSNEIAFAEIKTRPDTISNNATSDFIMPTAAIKSNSISVAISNDISDSLLSKILQEVSHA